MNRNRGSGAIENGSWLRPKRWVYMAAEHSRAQEGRRERAADHCGHAESSPDRRSSNPGASGSRARG
jgi:hypothetical protein